MWDTLVAVEQGFTARPDHHLHNLQQSLYLPLRDVVQNMQNALRSREYKCYPGRVRYRQCRSHGSLPPGNMSYETIQISLEISRDHQAGKHDLSSICPTCERVKKRVRTRAIHARGGKPLFFLILPLNLGELETSPKKEVWRKNKTATSKSMYTGWRISWPTRYTTRTRQKIGLLVFFSRRFWVKEAIIIQKPF